MRAQIFTWQMKFLLDNNWVSYDENQIFLFLETWCAAFTITINLEISRYKIWKREYKREERKREKQLLAEVK